MKVDHLAATAALLYAHVGYAVPHGNNDQIHGHLHKRSLATAYETVTDIVTVTDYNAVVWVDNAGKIVKTEYQTPATSTTSRSSVGSSSVSVATTPTPTTPSSIITSSSTVPVAASSASNAGDHRLNSIATTNAGSHPSSTTSVASVAPSSSAVAKVASGTNAASVFPGFGIAYDAWTGTGCRPNLDGEFAFLASQGARSIRVYDVCFTQAVNAAVAHGLRLMIGLTTFENFASHLGTLISEVTATSASWSVVDAVFIGNELVNSHAASSAVVAAQVSSARGTLQAAGFSGAVVTVDVWTAVRDDPTICSTSDFCAVNAHAFFDMYTLPQNAGPFVRMAVNSVAAANPGKRVVVTETGWPTAGATYGNAVPSVENQRLAMSSVVDTFAGTPADVFLFEAYDALYKSGPEIERNFGIFDSDHYNGTP